MELHEKIARLRAAKGMSQSDLAEALDEVLDQHGTKVLMKSGRQMPAVLDALKERNALGKSMLVQNCGLPEEAVSRSKRRRYENIALEYMATHEWEDGTPLRFDAIAICVNAPNRAILRHHVGFFDGCI